MEVISLESIWWIGFLIAVVAVYLATSKARVSSINRLGLPSRRISPTASTSHIARKPKEGSKSTPYKHILPPQGRQALSELKKGKVQPVEEDDVLENLIPMKLPYNTCQENMYTPTGISVLDIRDLKDFPDYTVLSGLPSPQPYHEFNIDTALPRPYRPFRWPYHQTMSISKMENDWWIELENTYKDRIIQRQMLYAQKGKRVLDYLPGSELACKELMELVLQYVCARYPQYFSLVDNRVFKNRILDTKQDVWSKPPLEILLDNIPEDFAITLRDDQTGCYIFRAGVICSSIGWSLDEKMGLPLHLVHAPVPDYHKMQTSMERFFTKLPTDKPIQRGSWSFEIGQPLWKPKDAVHTPQHEHHQDSDLKLEDCHLRVDWQTLRRLPLSAAVIFNFKALFTPVTEFRDEAGVPALVAKLLKDGKKSFLEYKDTRYVEHVVVPKMEEWSREQVENAVVAKDWEITTLDEGPYFRGWEEKWHRQQGF